MGKIYASAGNPCKYYLRIRSKCHLSPRIIPPPTPPVTITVTNAAGSVTSNAAALTLLAPRLSNVAVRTTLEADQVLTVGLTMQGGAKSALIRAAGPSLGALGVPNTLVDPKLQLFNSAGSKMDENDTYASTLAPTFASVGAFALTPGGKDAALVVTLPAGGYTVQVSGADGGTGTAIVEIYELP